MKDALKKLPDHMFWKFSVKLYEQSAVEHGLLALQNNYGMNVNCCLFFLWFGFNGQGGLSQTRIKQLLAASSGWHDRVVKPLRRLRQQVDLLSQPLKQAVLDEELAAEQVEQLMLADTLWFVSRRIKSPPKKVADICRSLLAYCTVMGIKIDAGLSHHVRSLLCAAFPMLDTAEITDICQQRLTQQKMDGVVGTQLLLDL